MAQDNIVEKALQQGLVDLTELHLQAKQAHWNIQGDGFQALHEHLDVITDAVRLQADEFAERLAALGFTADGRSETVAKTTTLRPIDNGPIEVSKGYRVMEDAIMTTVESIKKHLSEVDDADPLSGDLLIATARELEKSAWMLRMETK